MKKDRIDLLLCARGLADSRTRAQAIIMSGIVIAGGKKVEKPSELFPPDVEIRIKDGGFEAKYVSRGGLKLEAALESFNVDVSDKVCLDIGSSTGGFTDCLLQHGAAKVVAIDSGTNQMVWKLRIDPRVRLLERTNARYLRPDDFSERFDLVVMDVSFISVRKIIPAVRSLMSENGRMIVLIKPQFEVGKGEVGKGGIVRDIDKHSRVIDEINTFATDYGLAPRGVIESPIRGADGNKEFLALYESEPGG